MRRPITAFAGALALLLIASLLAGGGVRGQSDPEEIRAFDADMGPAYIDVSAYPPEYQALYPLFAQKCSKCHTLARPVNSSMTGDEWLAYVSRMSRKPGSGISPTNAEKIFDFLAYDSKVRARSADAVDPEMLPFLEVSEELAGVRRIVAANKNIPTDAAELRIRVQGDRRLDVKSFFAEDDGQKVLRWTRRDPSRCELEALPVDGLTGDPPGAETNPPDGPVAQAVAASVGEETDVWERVELILDWLDETIERAPQPGSGSAEDVLATRRGDATEFTRLFCAMARSAGIPCRTRVGLVGRRTSFHFHPWAEAWIDGWVPVDPYLGQFPADITHLRLATDEVDGLDAWDGGSFPGLDRLRLTVVLEDDEAEGKGAEPGNE